MKLRLLLALLATVLLSSAAQAQIGLYLNPIVTNVSDSQTDTGVFAFLGQGSTSRIFGGVSMGGYIDLGHTPKLNFGVDVRDELEHGNSALLNSFLIGGRLSGQLGRPALKPYVQLSGGLGTTRSPLSVVRANKPMYKIYAGVDYSLSRHVDFRVIEVGYGSVTPISTSLYGGAAPYPAVKLLSFSSGLVFRFGTPHL